MDSATQFMLGASIAGAMMGRQIGPRALLIGGIVATLPDLDSFIPTANLIDKMTEHRGASHSLFVLTIAAPVVTFVVRKIVPAVREHGWLTLATIWLCLFTHPLLDSLTTYGTQLFWPLNLGPPVAFPSVFIIDPAYTLLLVVGLLCFLFMRRNRERGLKTNQVFLALSVGYLAIGMTGQIAVASQARAHPEFKGKEVFVQPTPFNTLFWQVIAVDETSYVSGLTSILPGCPITDVRQQNRLANPPAGFSPSSSVKRLEWFTDGYFTYRNGGDGLSISDLRIGYDPEFVFSFEIARLAGNDFHAIDPRQVGLSRPASEILREIAGRLKDNWAAC